MNLPYMVNEDLRMLLHITRQQYHQEVRVTTQTDEKLPPAAKHQFLVSVVNFCRIAAILLFFLFFL